MYKLRVLIISNRKELSVKFKKIVEALEQEPVIASNLSDALSVMQNDEVEFIIISDTIKEKLSEFIKKIRILTYNFRPIIIAVSKSSDMDDRIASFEAGADDFIGEEISKQEFQARLKASFRRYIEGQINPVTRIANKSITIKAIKKSLLNSDSLSQISYLLIKIRGINTYIKTHGEIAGEKVIQTLGAIINTTLSKEDYLGHISEDEFIIITNSIKAEKTASFLAFAFDNILSKFYSADEFENNFTMQSGDDTNEEKESLMHLSVASFEADEATGNFREVLNSLNELIKLCDKSKNSTYIIDRVRLKGSVDAKKKNNKILIYEPDEALACLLKNVCQLNNIEAELVFSSEEFEINYKTFKPSVVLVDWGNKDKSIGLEIAKKVSKDNIKLIFSSSYLNKKEILKSGADLYIPKPYEIDDVILYIKKFIERE